MIYYSDGKFYEHIVSQSTLTT